MRLFLGIAIFLPLVLISFFVSVLTHDEDMDLRTEEAISLYKTGTADVVSTLRDTNKVICEPNKKLQICLDENISSVIYLTPGDYNISPFKLNSDQKLVIGPATKLKLSSEIEMPYKDGFVLGIMGSKQEPIRNVTLILDGTIDGNKSVHPYERSGNECIRVDYAQNLTIFGSGILQNCSGDGVDVDVSQDVLLSGIIARNNSGAGFHVGSGRPIESSKNILGVGLSATSNGFKLGRSGLDSSWPNANSNIYLLSIGDNNYRNWELEGAGALSLLSKSINSNHPDTLSGATYSIINGQKDLSLFENTRYIYKLLLRDLMFMYGTIADLFADPQAITTDYKGNRVGRAPEYLRPLTYSRSQ